MIRNTHKSNKNAKRLAACLVPLLLMGGCSMFRGSSKPAPQPASNGMSVVFPARDSATFKEGTFVSLDNLRRVIPGLTKPQVYDLLGAPHFHEGVFGVHTWNYIFNFRTGRGNEYITCQYQLHFDKDMKTDAGNWDKRECADLVYPRPAPSTPPPAAAA
ncbi:outer membrane protein assembly factor BamE, partial [Pigmentiphaga soli]|uniref:outer membrane protein assembly factor BamE n=1 Tax=Pigmentiphaga soli TaxID=1007095 RepID=UPI003CD054DB